MSLGVDFVGTTPRLFVVDRRRSPRHGGVRFAWMVPLGRRGRIASAHTVGPHLPLPDSRGVGVLRTHNNRGKHERR